LNDDEKQQELPRLPIQQGEPHHVQQGEHAQQPRQGEHEGEYEGEEQDELELEWDLNEDNFRDDPPIQGEGQDDQEEDRSSWSSARWHDFLTYGY
jgi:hypothetical protein